MSERDDRYFRPDLPSNTAEFRAAPDASASTAQFKAFAAGAEQNPSQPWPEQAWPEQPWAGTPSKSGSGRTVPIVIAVVVLIAVIVAVVVAIG